MTIHTNNLQVSTVTCPECPLIVDLDGTLILSDTLHESAIRLFRDMPAHTLLIPLWLAHGKGALKHKLSQQTVFDPTTLPYNHELAHWLREQKSRGRRLILCTATDQSIANAISQHLDLFNEVLASDGNTNLTGKHKAAVLEKRFGRGGFDYAGNSQADLDVWRSARKGIIVNASNKVQKTASQLCEIERTFSKPTVGLSDWRQVFRVHQWLKNVMLFAPLLAAHQFTNINSLLLLVLAFMSFSLCASTVYITNDLLDLESDRKHPRKRHRPFAAGAVPIAYGAVLAPLCAGLGLTLALSVNVAFTAWLVFYLALTFAYSLRLKRYALIDCITLASLYTLRIIAGAAAVAIPLSFWLLAFSGFLFLSLAFLKRYAELQVQVAHGNTHAHGRGYVVTDAPLVQTLGIAAGYGSALVLALYIHGETVGALYHTPDLIWCTVPLIILWISWVWLKAHRGQMDEDPLVFAITDKTSLVIAALFVATLVLATLWEGYQ